MFLLQSLIVAPEHATVPSGMPYSTGDSALSVALVIALGLVIIIFTTLFYFLARQVRDSHANHVRALEDGESLMTSNFALQKEVRRWKTSHLEKSAELDRAVSARKLLERRHASLVLRLSEGKSLDTLSDDLKEDLDKVRQINEMLSTDERSTVPMDMSQLASTLKRPQPAPPTERETPGERPSKK